MPGNNNLYESGTAYAQELNDIYNQLLLSFENNPDMETLNNIALLEKDPVKARELYHKYGDPFWEPIKKEDVRVDENGGFWRKTPTGLRQLSDVRPEYTIPEVVVTKQIGNASVPILPALLGKSSRFFHSLGSDTRNPKYLEGSSGTPMTGWDLLEGVSTLSGNAFDLPFVSFYMPLALRHAIEEPSTLLPSEFFGYTNYPILGRKFEQEYPIGSTIADVGSGFLLSGPVGKLKNIPKFLSTLGKRFTKVKNTAKVAEEIAPIIEDVAPIVTEESSITVPSNPHWRPSGYGYGGGGGGAHVVRYVEPETELKNLRKGIDVPLEFESVQDPLTEEQIQAFINLMDIVGPNNVTDDVIRLLRNPNTSPEVINLVKLYISQIGENNLLVPYTLPGDRRGYMISDLLNKLRNDYRWRKWYNTLSPEELRLAHMEELLPPWYTYNEKKYNEIMKHKRGGTVKWHGKSFKWHPIPKGEQGLTFGMESLFGNDMPVSNRPVTNNKRTTDELLVDTYINKIVYEMENPTGIGLKNGRYGWYTDKDEKGNIHWNIGPGIESNSDIGAKLKRNQSYSKEELNALLRPDLLKKMKKVRLQLTDLGLGNFTDDIGLIFLDIAHNVKPGGGVKKLNMPESWPSLILAIKNKNKALMYKETRSGSDRRMDMRNLIWGKNIYNVIVHNV